MICLALFFFSQECFGYSGSFVSPYKSDDFCSIFLNAIEVLMGIELNLKNHMISLICGI